MNDNKNIGYGVAAGLCFFTAVFTHDMTSDRFNMVDHFKTSTKTAYQILFLSSAIVGGISGGGLGAVSKHVANKRTRQTNPSGQALIL